MNNKLIRQLQETDIFTPVTRKEAKNRDKVLYPYLIADVVRKAKEQGYTMTDPEESGWGFTVHMEGLNLNFSIDVKHVRCGYDKQELLNRIATVKQGLEFLETINVQ